MRYIALLRGVNVGGHIVKMEALRAEFKKLGFSNVTTFIQSGNVFFDTNNTDEEKLIGQIEPALETTFGFPIPVCLRTVAEFEQILTDAPYAHQTPKDDERFCINFAARLFPQAVSAQSAPKPDLAIVVATEREAFVTWKIINSRPPSSQSNTWLNKTLGVPTTSRFYHTCQKILAAQRVRPEC